MTETLTRCPACGKEPILRKWDRPTFRHADDPAPPLMHYYQCCDDIGSQTGDSEPDARERWIYAVEMFYAIRREQHADELFDALKGIVDNYAASSYDELLPVMTKARELIAKLEPATLQ